jgi:RNA polymerase sigma-70 factor (ECF subfamily)
VRGQQREAQTAAEERPATALSDAALVAAAQRDPRAFAPLFDRYWAGVFRFCYYRLADWPEAEDAAGDVFANALAALPRLRLDEREDAFRCWLFTIARRVVANRHRHRARHPARPLATALGLADAAPSPEEIALAADDHRLVYELLTWLKPEQRELLELRLAGLTDAEIARVLGRGHDAVRKAQSRAIGLLRGFLASGAGAGEVDHA